MNRNILESFKAFLDLQKDSFLDLLSKFVIFEHYTTIQSLRKFEFLLKQNES